MIFYAPNVHIGGGFELLKSLLSSFDENAGVQFVLDYRIINRLDISTFRNVYWVKPDPISRFKAELFISRLKHKHDKIFCFHGLPPVFYKGGEIVVFLQNRLYITGFSVAGYTFKTALRLTFERLMFYVLRGKVSEFVVQSNSMKAQTVLNLKRVKSILVTVHPFISESYKCVTTESIEKIYDFAYIADGSAHKNHHALFVAWRLLAEKGHFPTLVVTLSDDNTQLIQLIAHLNRVCGCNIINIGYVPKDIIKKLYQQTRALIYPSLVESFGMPLIEAKQLGLAIVAAELDYVRDVVTPNETFNPHSSVSISLSVLRYLGESSPLVELKSPHEFISYLI
ncbi:glycosyltransferase [Shewanella colwelliana]|uniref:glycosyltransferase n=1 Tax=Shewanella colwelliana TaxID=23 RepID=UPI00299D95F5|nr:glycosyltransferase [Shewanella colwelliana]MDX1281576.1 glycosyltransferase [Shewanella colwelliana]